MKMSAEAMEIDERERRPTPPEIFLTMTDAYARSWKTWDGIREFVQNWYDAVLHNLEECSPPAQGIKNLKVTSEVRACDCFRRQSSAFHVSSILFKSSYIFGCSVISRKLEISVG